MESEQGRLLIIDNNATKRDILARHLEQLGYMVALAIDGRQALDMLALGEAEGAQTPEFDLLLLDVRIPEIDSYQALEQLKADPRLRHIPVIVTATANDVDRVVKCIELGAEDYVLEPFDPALLKVRIGANLEERAHLKKAEKLTHDLRHIILPLGIALSAEKNLDRLLERILVEAKSICNADAGTLYRRTEDDCLRFAIMLTDSLNIAMGGTTGKAIPFAPLCLYDETTGEPNNRNVATYVALHGHPINIPDIYHSKDFDFSATREFDEKNNYHSISSFTVPLRNHVNKVVGVLQLFNAQDPTTDQVIPFDSYQQLVVESLASQAAVTLNTQMLLRRQQSLLKFEHDLQIGRQIQFDFLPNKDELPQPAGWEIAVCFQPARQVAGDFYDVFPLAGNKVGLVIADVCDKGVGAALFMALSRSLLRAFVEQHRPLSWMDGIVGDRSTAAADRAAKRRRMMLSAGTSALLAVALTNNYISENHGDMCMFATLFFGVLDPTTGELTYINGGHDPPAIVGPDGMVKTRLSPTGPAVGMLPDVDFDVQQATLEPGDLLMAFSDGVPDARNPDGKRFTVEGLFSLLKQSDPSVAALLERIEATLRAYIADAEQFDDITMLAVRRAPISEA